MPNLAPLKGIDQHLTEQSKPRKKKKGKKKKSK